MLPACQGRYVPREKAIEDFEKIVTGDYDNFPEEAFYMVGTLEEVLQKAEKLLQQRCRCCSEVSHVSPQSKHEYVVQWIEAHTPSGITNY